MAKNKSNKNNESAILAKIKNINNDKMENIKKIMDQKKKYKIDFFKSGKNKMIGIFDNKKMILAGDYNFYGIFQPSTNLWIWASSIPGVDKNHIKNIQKIKSFSHLFDSDTDPKNNFYFQLLTQDVLYIQHEKMLEWINELILYLSDDIYYFNPINSDQNIQFLTLANIKEKYI
jgi:hypothetical protein